jgi:hypothetical protein
MMIINGYDSFTMLNDDDEDDDDDDDDDDR